MRKSFLTLFLTTIVFVTYSQDRPQVKATVSTDSMMIGDHFSLRVEISKDMMQVVDFPIFDNGELAKAIEILVETDVDTVAKNGRNVTIGKSYTLTCFDEGNYALAPFPALYIDKNIVDTIWSPDSLRFKIYTMAVDTTSQTIYDIKQPLETPLRFGEISGYLLWAVFAAIIIAAAVYIIVRKLRNSPLLNHTSAPLSPHIAAIQQLEKLHSQKLWQSGKHKLYYTNITDILRIYLEGRYGIAAMEMTSAEILTAISTLGITDRTTVRLKDTLLASDYVKFAKYQPDNETNEKAFMDAYYFVEETKPDETEIVTNDENIDAESAEPKQEEGKI